MKIGTLALLLSCSAMSSLVVAADSPSKQVGSEAKKAAMHEMHGTMTKMQKSMDAAPMTGDADRDFVQMMIPHHQGAIDMSRVYLKTGKDPALRTMAEKIIKDQEKEIKDFQAWLSKHPAPSH